MSDGNNLLKWGGKVLRTINRTKMSDRLGIFLQSSFRKAKGRKVNCTQARIYNPELVTVGKKGYPYKRGTKKTNKTSFYDVPVVFLCTLSWST